MQQAPGVGPVRYAQLLERFGSPAAVFAASRSDLRELNLPETALAYIAEPDWSRVEHALAWLEKPNNHLICWYDSNYPRLLKELAQAPPLLFVHGDPTVLCSYQIAIVGTRQPTASGRQTARDFAAHLAAAGMVVTSGLALGIDGEAHRGALSVKGRTIAVMGTGLNRIYPSKHHSLAHEISEQGALVSELPLDTPALAENFPRRNRIISGLALGTLVVEAALRSGSLITARLAAEQGREVFAIPGSIHNPMAKGCHDLLRQGAKLVETAEDILEELGPLAAVAEKAYTVETDLSATPDALPEDVLDQDYRDLLAHFPAEPIAIDVLVERCGLTVETVSSMLLILELQGYVVAAPGGLYSRCSQ